MLEKAYKRDGNNLCEALRNFAQREPLWPLPQVYAGRARPRRVESADSALAGAAAYLFLSVTICVSSRLYSYKDMICPQTAILFRRKRRINNNNGTQVVELVCSPSGLNVA